MINEPQKWKYCFIVVLLLALGCQPGTPEPTATLEATVTVEPTATAEATATLAPPPTPSGNGPDVEYSNCLGEIADLSEALNEEMEVALEVGDDREAFCQSWSSIGLSEKARSHQQRHNRCPEPRHRDVIEARGYVDQALGYKVTSIELITNWCRTGSMADGQAAFEGSELYMQLCNESLAKAISILEGSYESVDLWHIVVTLDDLPSGFQEIPNEEWWGEEAVAEADLNGGSLFALVEPERSQSVFGLSTFLATIAEAGVFDAILHRPTMLMEVVVGPAGELDVIEQAELEPLADIGDVSAGITLVIDMGADRGPARMDIVGFRRGDVGVTVCVMYPDGDTPIVSIQHVSRELDDRAKPGGLEPAAVTEPGPVSPSTILHGYQIAVDEDVRLSFVHPSGWVEDRGGFTVRESTATLSFVAFTIQSELGAHYKLIQFMRIDQSLGRTPETLIEQVLGVNEDRLEEADAEILETPQGVDVDGEPASGIVYRLTDPRGVRIFAILLAVSLPDSGYIFQWASSIEHEQEMKQIYEVTLPTIEFTE